MIKYTNKLLGIKESNLKGFFVDWPNPPSYEKHYELLNNSSYFWLALDEETNNIVGFITAISDNTLCTYIPLLEVLPAYQNKGIGKELVKNMLDTLSDFYMVDLLCDKELQSFYEKVDMYKGHGMFIRNFEKQSGR